MIEKIALGTLLFIGLILAFLSDRASHHPYLGLGDEQTKIEHGAEWEECPDCERRTAVYKHDVGGIPPGGSTSGTVCGKCGASIGWDPEEEEAFIVTSGDEREPYDWR